MAKGLSWRNPPALMVIGGDEPLLRKRELQGAVRVSTEMGRDIERASSDAEMWDAFTTASTFGSDALIIISLDDIEPESFELIQKEKLKGTCVLVYCEGTGSKKAHKEKLAGVHSGFQRFHNRPSKKKDLKNLAVRFARHEASQVLGDKEALPAKLAEALVSAVGDDLGVIAFEIAKAAALCRSESKSAIEVAHLKALIRPNNEVDMGPLRQALRNRDRKKVAAELNKIKRLLPGDPVMLLLRAKGAPADLLVLWLQAAYLIERRVPQEHLPKRLGVPEWAINDVMIAVKKWGLADLRKVVGELSRVDSGVFRGAPSPWDALETVLLTACR